jgi:competence protein ComEC
LIIWQGRIRWAAAVPAALGLALWVMTDRPLLLIADDGRLVGLLGPEGRALSQSRGSGFSAETWLENDGDLALQPLAARRGGFEGPRDARRFEIEGLVGISLTGKNAAANLKAACAEADLVITTAPVEGPVPPDCRIIDPVMLARTGALSGSLVNGDLVLSPSHDSARRWRGEAAPAGEMTLALGPARP